MANTNPTPDPTPSTYSSLNSAALHAINSTDLNDLEKLLMNNNQLVERTSTILNNMGTDAASIALLDSEQQSLETSRTSIMNVKNDLNTQKTNLGNKKILINGREITLRTWINNHPFRTWNYSNKISKIEVHYSSFGIMGMRILYKDSTKASVTLGIVTSANTSSPITIQSVDFTDDEWLMQIQITNPNPNTNTNSNMSNVALCNSISFYTSKNAPGTSPKVTIPASVQNTPVENKTYFIDPTPRTWLQHKSNAEAQGAELACFKNSVETENALAQLGDVIYQYGSFYIGLYHTNALIPNNFAGGGQAYDYASNVNSNWKWVDNTPYDSNTTNWNGGEPNNWGGSESVAQIYINGKFNDLNKNGQLAAIYQRKMTNTTTQTLRKDDEHIKSFTIKPLDATYDFITSLDMSQRANALSAADSTKQVISDIENSVGILNTSITHIDNAIAKININIEHIKAKKAKLAELNTHGNTFLTTYGNQTTSNNQRVQAAQTQGFTNIGGSFLSDYMLNMREGFVEGNQGLQGAATTAREEAARITGNLVNDIQAVKNTQTANAISEFVIKKDNLFTNVLTDYMLNDEKQNNFEGVYNKIDQQNIDKMRNIELNTYYDKAYKEYINILKIIIFACVILVPIVIANKNSLLPNSITNILVVSIIFLTIIYIISKFIDIYMRDNKDFDKIRIPYDREAAILEKNGTITRKNNLLSAFSLTCIGSDCCPESSGVLIYDPVKNRCVANETFTEYFNGGSSSFSLVEPYESAKEYLVGTSLRNSTTNAMNSTIDISNNRINTSNNTTNP
jgi:prefoldin subunit 5